MPQLSTMDRQLSPEEAQPVIEAVTPLLPNAQKKTEQVNRSPKQYYEILIAGDHSDDALPDLMVLHQDELDSCFRARWKTKLSINSDPLKGRQEWCWIMESFCDLYNGADLDNDRIFKMFQIHMAFTDRNELGAKKPFKFGLMDAYCALTSRNKNVKEKKQDWKIDLNYLHGWVLAESKKLEEELPAAEANRRVSTPPLSPGNDYSSSLSEGGSPQVKSIKETTDISIASIESDDCLLEAEISESSELPKSKTNALSVISPKSTPDVQSDFNDSAIVVDHLLGSEQSADLDGGKKLLKAARNSRKRAREDIQEIGLDLEDVAASDAPRKKTKTGAASTRKPARKTAERGPAGNKATKKNLREVLNERV